MVRMSDLLNAYKRLILSFPMLAYFPHKLSSKLSKSYDINKKSIISMSNELMWNRHFGLRYKMPCPRITRKIHEIFIKSFRGNPLQGDWIVSYS